MKRPSRDEALRVNVDKRLLEVEGRRYRLTELRGRTLSYRDRFTLVFHDTMRDLTMKPLSAVAARTMWWGLDSLDHQRYKAVYQSSLSALFEVSQPTVSRALEELCARGIFEREKTGRTFQYRLNSDASWRGSAGAWHKWQREKASAEPIFEMTGDDLRREQRELQDDVDRAINAGVDKVMRSLEGNDEDA